MAVVEPASLLTDTLRSQFPIYKRALSFSILISLLLLAPTVFMLQVYDRVITSRSTVTLLSLLICVIGIYAICEILDFVRNRLLQKAGWVIDGKLRSLLHDLSFSTSLNTGNPSTQAFADLRTLREFISSSAVTAVLDLPASLVFLLLLYLIGPWICLMALFGAIMLTIVGYYAEKNIARVLTQANQAAIHAQIYATGVLRNAPVIAAMGFAKNIHQRWVERQRNFLALQALASDAASVNAAASKFIQSMQSSLIVGASCWLFLKGAIAGSGGMIIVASTLGGRVLVPIIQLTSQWRAVVNALNAFQRLDNLIGPPGSHTRPMSLPAPTGSLTVEGVVGAAPTSPIPIIRGVSFTLSPGENLMVIGPSAAGKTTLARLLLGIWPAASGKVRLDGADIHAWLKDELGPYVGYLPQDVELFDGTLAENIARFGERNPDWLRSAAESVGLMSLIDERPNGFETRVGDDGVRFSGGQRQRIALARAIYGEPTFVLLDEPNSNLDAEGEEALMKTLMSLKQRKCTTIVITHRSTLLPAADKMLVLRDGQVVAFGPRDEVMNRLRKGASQQRALPASKPKIAEGAA